VRVSNRTHERAVQLARQYGGEAVPFVDLFECLTDIDIVISSTGAHEPIIRAKDMRDVLHKRKNKPMFFIDIAVPRDIDPDVNALDNIYLYDIDDLQEVVEENLAGRREEALRGHEIVAEETEIFCAWMKSLRLQPTIVDIVQRGEDIAQAELDRTLKKLGPMPDNTQKILSAMLSSVVKKLNHEPIMFLKRRFNEEEEHIAMIRRMFNLDNDARPDQPHFGRSHPDGSRRKP